MAPNAPPTPTAPHPTSQSPHTTHTHTHTPPHPLQDSAPLPSASGARELPRGVLRALSMSRAMASQVRSAAATPRGAVSSLSKQAVTAAAMGAFQSGLGRLGSGESAGGSGGRASDTGTQRGATGLGTVEERGGWGDSRGIWRSTESSGGGGSTTEDEGGLGRRGSVPGGGAPSSRGASRRSSYQTSMAPAGLKNYGMGTHQKSAVPDRHLWGSKEDYIGESRGGVGVGLSECEVMQSVRNIEWRLRESRSMQFKPPLPFSGLLALRTCYPPLLISSPHPSPSDPRQRGYEQHSSSSPPLITTNHPSPLPLPPSNLRQRRHDQPLTSLHHHPSPLLTPVIRANTSPHSHSPSPHLSPPQ